MNFKILTFISLIATSSAWSAQSTKQEMTLRQNFLTEILLRVQADTLLNQEAAKKILGCMNSKNNSLPCQITRDQIIAPFPQVVAESRLHLAMGYRDGFLSGSFRKANTKLKAFGTYKDVAWDKLSSQEEAVTQILLKRYEDRARVEASKNTKINTSNSKLERFIDLSIREKRVNHLNTYKDLLSQIVLLQYMENEIVNDVAIRSALNKLLDRSHKEVSSLAQAASVAHKWITSSESCAQTIDYQLNHPTDGVMSFCIQTPSKLLQLLDYRAAVDGILMENPSYLKVYNSLQSERTARSIGLGLLVGLPTMAVCMLAPPLVAIPAAALSGGLSFLSAQNDYNKIRRRELSTVINVNGNVDWDALKAGRFARNMSVALLPFFGAGRVVSPYLKTAMSPAARFISGFTKIKYLKNVKVK